MPAKYKISCRYTRDGAADKIVEHQLNIPAVPGTYKIKIGCPGINGGVYESPEIVVGKERKQYRLTIGYTHAGGATYKTGIITTPSLAIEDLSWEDIAAISEAGKAKEVFKVGDEKLLDEELGLYAEILGFDHDDLADGSGKAGITFAIKGSLIDSDLSSIGITVENPTQMNATDTLVGGYGESKLHREVLSRLDTTRLFNGFASNIKSVRKTYNTYRDLSDRTSYVVNEIQTKFFLFSLAELSNQGNNNYAWGAPVEGKFYDGFNSGYVSKDFATWSRTIYPDANHPNSYFYSDDTGYIIGNFATTSTTSIPIRFGFCL